VRPFIDREGARWDVVLGRESWGGLVLLFVPAAVSPIRQAFFPADGYDTAMVELDLLPDERLQQLLDESQPKTE
jgi:hypothetical protein